MCRRKAINWYGNRYNINHTKLYTKKTTTLYLNISMQCTNLMETSLFRKRRRKKTLKNNQKTEKANLAKLLLS